MDHVAILGRRRGRRANQGSHFQVRFHSPVGGWPVMSSNQQSRDIQLSACGKSKTESCRRIIQVAKVVPDCIMAMISDRIAKKGLSHGVHQGYIVGNEYFAGAEGREKNRLKLEWAEAALGQLFRDLDLGLKVSVPMWRIRTHGQAPDLQGRCKVGPRWGKKKVGPRWSPGR